MGYWNVFFLFKREEYISVPLLWLNVLLSEDNYLANRYPLDIEEK